MRVYAPFWWSPAVSPAATPSPSVSDCNCQALRQAARHVSQFYDQCLAPSGLRTSQYSILVKLNRKGPMTINALASDLVMDRTTLGRNILPLDRDGLISIAKGGTDRRRKEVRLTPVGAERMSVARDQWAEAQARFEAVFGEHRAAELRSLLGAVVASHLDTAPGADRTADNE
jgi:DNA-binding MarR family transcriptional regulator